MTTPTPWFAAAIAMATQMQREAYERANKKPDGTFYKVHRPYTPDPEAVALANAAHSGDEHETKRIMYCLRVGARTMV